VNLGSHYDAATGNHCLPAASGNCIMDSTTAAPDPGGILPRILGANSEVMQLELASCY